MTGMTNERYSKIESAVIELGRVSTLLKLVNEQIEAAPSVEDIQNAFFIFEELFSSKYKALENACYGEDKEDE